MDLDVKSKAVGLVSMLLVIFLLFTWFLPAINGATAINNSSTLWLGGVNYTWFVPVLVIVILMAIVLWFLGVI